MNNIFTVFKFELKNAIRSSAFIFSTLILVMMIIIGSIVFKMTSKDMEQSVNDAMNSGGAVITEDIGVYISDSDLNMDLIKEIYKGANITAYESEEDLKAAVGDATVSTGLVFNSLSDMKVISSRDAMFTQTSYSEPVRNYLVDEELKNKGITAEEIANIEGSINVNVVNESLNPISPIAYPLSMFLSFVIYLMVIMNGSISATSVAREKSDRTMELLITSTDPVNLINGKVIAAFAQGLLTLISYGTAAVIGYLINKETLDKVLMGMDWTFDPMILIIFILFFIVGYTMYLYVYAALGATVSKVEEVNVAVTPAMLVIIAVYITTTMAYSNPDGNMMKILSFVPFSSPFTMHARYALTDMPFTEVWISLGILVVSTFILSFLSIKLYRSASLNYGNQNKFFAVLNRIFGRKRK